ncbi:co-chaperone GroES [bacterium]|nr:co-chaperone GroES [bacterium]
MLQPQGDRVVIEVKEKNDTTSGGVVLLDSAVQKESVGTVVSVGKGRLNNAGEHIPLDVAQGDLVIFSKYAGTEVTHDEKSYLIVREADILAVVQ